MAQTFFVDRMQAHPRSMACPCVACNEDLLVFSEDEFEDELEAKSARISTDFDARSDVATVGFIESSEEKYSARDDPYHPGNKGDATWNGNTIYTADGWILTVRPIAKMHYESVKGIDLVRWFTENYVKEQQEREQRQRKHLNVTHPQPVSETDSAQNSKSKKRRRNKNKYSQSQSQFLTLPAEIRNKIYSYAIPESRILIQGNKPGKEYTKLKSYWNPLNKYIPKPRYRLSYLLDNDDTEDGLGLTGALLLVCKRIKQEVQLFMYAQPIFCFDSTKVLRKFIDRSTAESLRAITKLELFHVGYGEPKLTGNRIFKQKHDRNWREACQLISEEMLSLSSLKLTLKICDWPVTLRQDDRWMKAALELVSGGPLKHVKVTLTHSHDMIGEDRLVRAARRLEDRMMTAEGKFLRDEREANFLIQQHLEAESIAESARLERLKVLPPVQAKRVLKIVLDKKDSNAAVRKELRKYVVSDTTGYMNDCDNGVYKF